MSRPFTGHAGQAAAFPDSWAVGNRFLGTWVGDCIIPLPADYIGGADLLRKAFERNSESYLNGVWRNQGWWYYYLEAFAIKEPLGFLILIVWRWPAFSPAALGSPTSRKSFRF